MIAQTILAPHLPGAAVGAVLADVTGAVDALVDAAHRVAAATGFAEL